MTEKENPLKELFGFGKGKKINTKKVLAENRKSMEPRESLKKLYGSLKFRKSTKELLKESRKEFESKWM